MRPPTMLQRIVIAATAACLALALASCMRAPEAALRIGTNVWIGSEPLYLARELGQLDPAVVQLVEYPSASEVLRAYRNEAIDGMVISLDELFGLAVDGLQPGIILVVDVSHGAEQHLVGGLREQGQGGVHAPAARRQVARGAGVGRGGGGAHER